MGRDAMFGILCGVLSAQGREKTLIGPGLSRAREAFARMYPEADEVHAYFEIPLLGEPSVDVHCILGYVPSRPEAPKEADPAWAHALAWMMESGPFETKGRDVALMAEADTGEGAQGQTGMYIIQRERADLVEPFLTAAGAPEQLDAWKAFAARLPKDWETTYTGLFPGRPGSLLRVNMHPQSREASGFDGAQDAVGVQANGQLIDAIEELSSQVSGFDVQLDVDADGIAQGMWGFELYRKSEHETLFGEGGCGPYLASEFERLGVADERWRLLPDVEFSRQLAVPGNGGMASCLVSIRCFSLKMKIANGKMASGKAYFRADTLMER